MNWPMFVLGGFVFVMGAHHAGNALDGDPSRPGWYVVSMIAVGLAGLIMARVR